MCENTLYSVKNGDFSAEKKRGEFRTKIRTETRIRGKVPSNFTFFPKRSLCKNVCPFVPCRSSTHHITLLFGIGIAALHCPLGKWIYFATAGLEEALKGQNCKPTGLKLIRGAPACCLVEVLLPTWLCPAPFPADFVVFYCVLWLCFCQRLAKGKLCFAFCLGAKSWQFDPKFQKDFKGFQLKRCLFKCLNFASKKLEEFKV